MENKTTIQDAKQRVLDLFKDTTAEQANNLACAYMTLVNAERAEKEMEVGNDK